jgi:gallate dioxygenase
VQGIRSYYLPSMTGIATAVYEVPDEAPDAATREAPRAHGARARRRRALRGHVSVHARAQRRAYRINDYLHRMVRARASRRRS